MDWDRSEVVLRPAANMGRGFVLWRICHFGGGLLTRTRLQWFPDRDAAVAYMRRHPELSGPRGAEAPDV